MFTIKIRDTKEEVAKEAFQVMKPFLHDGAVLGLATGSSPVGLYKEMIADHQENGTSYQNIITVNLDEYVGLPRDHQESYWTFMHQNLFNHVDIPDENVHVPLGNGDLEKNCADYDAYLDEHPQDIQLLGIGSNGHIAFNEPGTPFESGTYVTDLDESTRKDNARFFDPLGQEVPTQAVTMGLASIMKAKNVLLIATGANKAEAVAAMINGPVTTDCPASILQNHPNVTVILDCEAAGRIAL